MPRPGNKAVTISLPESLHRALKNHCASKGKGAMSDLIASLLASKLNHPKVPKK
jgi:hypothetical protein